MCAAREAFCLVILFRQVRLRISLWVSAENKDHCSGETHCHISGDKGGGNLLAEDLTSSLWLVVELTESHQQVPGSGSQLTPPKQKQHQTHSLWTRSGISHSDTPSLIKSALLFMVPTVPLSNFLPQWFKSQCKMKYGFSLNARENRIFELKDGLMHGAILTFKLNTPAWLLSQSGRCAQRHYLITENKTFLRGSGKNSQILEMLERHLVLLWIRPES